MGVVGSDPADFLFASIPVFRVQVDLNSCNRRSKPQPVYWETSMATMLVAEPPAFDP